MMTQSLNLLATGVDFMGTLLIAGSAFRVLWLFLRQPATPSIADTLRVRLATDLVTALSVKSGAGIIRTLTVGSWPQFFLVLGIISLRFFLGQALKRLYRRPAV